MLKLNLKCRIEVLTIDAGLNLLCVGGALWNPTSEVRPLFWTQANPSLSHGHILVNSLPVHNLLDVGCCGHTVWWLVTRVQIWPSPEILNFTWLWVYRPIPSRTTTGLNITHGSFIKTVYQPSTVFTYLFDHHGAISPPSYFINSQIDPRITCYNLRGDSMCALSFNSTP